MEKLKKDKISKKNYSDWIAQGGHSPEVKSEMDKMWADRQSNGEKYNIDPEQYENDRLGNDYFNSKQSFNNFTKDLTGNGWDAPLKVDTKNTDLKPHKDWRGYTRMSSDIDKPSIGAPAKDASGIPYKNSFKTIQIDKNGHDIPDWSKDDEMAVAKRNQDLFKELGINETIDKCSDFLRKLIYKK